MQRVVLSLDGPRPNFQSLAHCRQQPLDRVHRGRNLPALDSADRGLIGAGTQRQGPLADTPFGSHPLDQGACIHKLDDVLKGIACQSLP
jgi:hypothetical protein